MVKVQKPQPKSLNKSSSIKGLAKKKNYPEKVKLTAAVTALEVPAVSNKNAKNAVLKKGDGGARPKKEQAKPVSKQEPEKKYQKRPLILAPPVSSAVPPAASKKSKVKAEKQATKRPLILTPPESPVVPKKEVKTKAAHSAPAFVKKESAKKSGKPAAAKKSGALPAPTNKSVRATIPVKQAQKPGSAAQAPKKAQKSANNTVQLTTKKAPPPASRQKKKISPQNLSKPVKAPNTKRLRQIQNEPVKGKGIATKKETVKKSVELTFELKPFNEQSYQDIVSEPNVQKVCQALKKLVAEEVKKKKATSIFADYRYVLQVASYKIPSCPKRMVKLALKHSLVGSNDDVAIIVTDLQRGAKFDYEPTKQHYEDLLREAGVEQRLTVVPFNRLRNEMGTFEAKRKFLNSYDYLMCDGRLSGQANAFLGKFAQKPRNVLHAVRLTRGDEKISQEVSRALNRTAFRQLAKGDLISIPVGNHEHSVGQLAENIQMVSNQLQQLYPGGLANIRSMYLKIDIVGTSALPLYVSMCAPPADAPYVVGPREQRMLKLKKRANEVLARFALTKDADFIKLTKDQVKRKAELRAERAALLVADAAPKDNDGEDTAVPTKKSRKDSNSENAKAEAESDGDEVEEDEGKSAAESGDENDGDDDDGDDDEDIDEEDDEDDDDDDDDDEDDDDEDDE
ncbi:hypothetical protein KR009_001334 [Drosophila setifemur]|nr:hypothetical protein KR009_001334 [Drosophila setifemur]